MTAQAHDEALHPRETTGKFATKPVTDAAGGLDALAATSPAAPAPEADPELARRQALHWSDPEALPRFEGDEKNCRDPWCPDTNWGGRDRVHTREPDCPPMKPTPLVFAPPIEAPADLSSAGHALLADLGPLGLRGHLVEESSDTLGWTRLEITNDDVELSILAHYDTTDEPATTSSVVVYVNGDERYSFLSGGRAVEPQQLRQMVRAAVTSGALTDEAQAVFGDDLHQAYISGRSPRAMAAETYAFDGEPAVDLTFASGPSVAIELVEGNLQIAVNDEVVSDPYWRDLACRDLTTRYKLGDSAVLPATAVRTWLTDADARARASDKYRTFFG